MKSIIGKSDGGILRSGQRSHAVLLIACLSVACGEREMNLREGEPAPDFALLSQDGTEVRLSNFRGRHHVVLYFYPKDDTPGCTKEACAFRDDMARFKEVDAKILGVSVDDVDSHKEFEKKYGLNFTLLADPDKVVTKSYGVKSWYGLANRVTFVIDKEGIIRKIYPSVDVSKHSDEVLEFLRTI